MPTVAATRRRRLSPWGRLVAACAAIVAAVLVFLGVGAVSTKQQRVIESSVRGSVGGVMLDLGNADVAVVGGGGAGVQIRETQTFAFGHHAATQRRLSGGVVEVRSRCPRTVLHSCGTAFRVIVPANVPVDVRTEGGGIRLVSFRGSARLTSRGGSVSVTGFCGFSLAARTESGPVTASAACAPQELTLASNAGAVHAIVPPGRYQVDAESASGRAEVRGLTTVDQSPYSVQATSSTGDVLVESGA